MMLRKIIFSVLFIFLLQGFAFSQSWDRTNGCITDTLRDSEAVFTRFTTEPMFKGNMKWFLTRNISLDVFLHSMQISDTIFADTVRIKFIMSKKGEISNISVTKTRYPVFESEALRLFRLSSCSWERGDQGGRYVNGWAQFEIYFCLIREYGEIVMNIDYKQIVPPDLSM